MFIHEGNEYTGPLSKIGETVPPDEIIKLNCLQMAIDFRAADALRFAKEMYEWVKEESVKAQPDGEKWNVVSDEVKYSYDLTGCVGSSKNIAGEQPK